MHFGSEFSLPIKNATYHICSFLRNISAVGTPLAPNKKGTFHAKLCVVSCVLLFEMNPI